MPWPALGKKKDESPEGRCVHHYYRPATGQCTVCGLPVCDECLRGGNVCKQCVEHPMSPEEAAKARARAKKKLPIAKKPLLKKKTAAPAKPKTPNKLLPKLHLDVMQKDIILKIAIGVLTPVLAVLILLTLTGKNPFGVVKPEVSPETKAAQVKTFVSAAVNRIELYRNKNGKLPETLKDIGITDLKPWKYETLSSDQYMVEVTLDGQSFSFNSNQDYHRIFPGMIVSQPTRRSP